MKKVSYIRGLDGLRCISIILVLLDHLGLKKYLYSFFSRDIADRIYIATSGKTGVSIFFVISGYLITHLLIEEKKANGKINLKKFFVRRFFRLFPAFFAFMTCLLCFLINANAGKNVLEAWCISFIYLYNFVPYGNLRIVELGHTWSLAVEEQFYIVWSIFLYFINQKVVRGILLFSAVFFVFFKLYYDTLSISSLYESYRLTIPGAFPIVLGCLIAFWSNEVGKSNNILGSVLFACSLWLPISDINFNSQLSFFIQPIGVSLIINGIVNNKSSMVVDFLEYPVFVWVGRLSYSIYLWQGLFLKNAPGSDFWIQKFPQNIFLTFLVAAISFYVIEKKFTTIKNKYRVVSLNHD